MLLLKKNTTYKVLMQLIAFALLSAACSTTKKAELVIKPITADSTIIPKSYTSEIVENTTAQIEKKSELEEIFIEKGLVNVRDYNKNIMVDLKYASTDNFVGINMYGEIKEAYLQKPVAIQLAKAQKFLEDTLPGYRLLVLDAARPASIQKIMWDSIKVTSDMKSKFISNPNIGSIHNYGAAVDVTIIDSIGNELDMGTPYDCFEKTAYTFLEDQMLKNGKLTKQQISNRKILRSVMYKALFSGITTEWWHFNACGHKDAKNFYTLIKSHTHKKNKAIKVKNIEADEIFFKVQIKVSAEKLALNSAIFKNLTVEEYHHKNLHKYVTGKTKNIAEAYSILEKAENLGFKDAFIVAFNKDKRIEVRDALELLQ